MTDCQILLGNHLCRARSASKNEWRECVGTVVTTVFMAPQLIIQPLTFA